MLNKPSGTSLLQTGESLRLREVTFFKGVINFCALHCADWAMHSARLMGMSPFQEHPNYTTFILNSNLWIGGQDIDTEVRQPARTGKVAEKRQNF